MADLGEQADHLSWPGMRRIAGTVGRTTAFFIRERIDTPSTAV